MSGFVYFIGPEALFDRDLWSEAAKVKIGFTRNDPECRLHALQCGSPVHLNLLAYIDGSPELEKAFHGTFSEIRSHGEWFFCHHKLRAFLSDITPDDWKAPRYVTRERLLVALYDTVFAPNSPNPEVSDQDYCSGTDHRWLIEWFPEVCEV